MSAFFLPFLILSAMAFGAIMLSCFTLLHTRSLFRMRVRAETTQKEAGNAIESMASRLNALAAELEQVKNRPATLVPSGIPKPGFNLSKRTQALRMHRRGDPPEHIAAALEISRQEVDLLLKVHQIVISNI